MSLYIGLFNMEPCCFGYSKVRFWFWEVRFWVCAVLGFGSAVLGFGSAVLGFGSAVLAQARHGAVGGNHPRRKRSILAARQGRLPAGGVARTPPAGRFSPAAWAPGAHSLLDFTYHLPGIHILELNKAARRRGGGARGPKSLLWRNLGAYTCIYRRNNI